MSAATTGAHRPRGRELDERIVDVALGILRSRGSLAVNMESVAAAAGVAKTTVYRRYEDRSALLRAAIASATTEVAIPTELPTYEMFRWLLVQSRDTVENIVGRGTVAAILVDEDPEFTALLRAMITVRAHALTAFVDERIRAGDLRADLDFGLVATILLGAVLGQVVRGRAIDERWADEVLALLWPSLVNPAAATSSG